MGHEATAPTTTTAATTATATTTTGTTRRKRKKSHILKGTSFSTKIVLCLGSFVTVDQTPPDTLNRGIDRWGQTLSLSLSHTHTHSLNQTTTDHEINDIDRVGRNSMAGLRRTAASQRHCAGCRLCAGTTRTPLDVIIGNVQDWSLLDSQPGRRRQKERRGRQGRVHVRGSHR